MTVGELIKKLEKYNKDQDVWFTHTGMPNIVGMEVRSAICYQVHIHSAKRNYGKRYSLDMIPDGEEPIEISIL